MTDLELTNGLIDHLKIVKTCPATPLTAKVVAFSGSTIQLDTPTGASNTWVGGVVKFVDGDAKNKQAVITTSNGNVVKMSDKLHPARLPDVGDTVRLSRGPLGEASIYKFDPGTMASQIKQGKKFFIMVSPLSGERSWRAFASGSRDKHADIAKNDLLGFQVLGLSPDRSAGEDRDLALEIAEEMYVFKEQMLVMIHWFRFQEENEVSGSGPISYSYETINLIGDDQNKSPYRAIIVQFDIATQ